MSKCNGICVFARELIEGMPGVAYPHPECPAHSPVRDEVPNTEWNREAQAAENEGLLRHHAL